MDIILKEIVAIIKEETEKINKKIYGTTFLEILKEKILNRQDQISLKNLEMQNSNIDLEENINVLEKNLFFKLSLYQNPKSLLKLELKKNYLLIVFKEAIKIDILNQNHMILHLILICEFRFDDIKKFYTFSTKGWIICCY